MITITELYDLYTKYPVITTDTRDCPRDSLFFALRGANFDGNAFALKALEAGCSHAIVDDAGVTGDPRLVHVPDVLRTLQELAAFHRQRLGIPVLQVTGTNGKTTTKELTAAVLAQKYNVLYTQGNLNNHIGVPKTLLRLTAAHKIAVIETGANHPGEIAELSRITDADCGLITNVGMAHIEGFGSFEGVVRTKSELYDYLRTRQKAFVFLNADNRILAEKASGLPQYTYGSPGHGYDVEGEVKDCTPYLNLRWRVRDGEWHEVQTQLIGAYNIDNVLAAVAAGTRFGVDVGQISRAIADYRPTNNRSELKKTAANELIVDAYNANPTSMKAALENFRLIGHPHKLAILGEMRELGPVSADEHKTVVRLAETTGCEELWLVGKAFAGCADGHRHFEDVEAVKQALEAEKPSGRLILIKGSNGTKLYQLPDFL